MQTIYTYFIALTTFLMIDSIWLGFVAKNFYQKQIGFLLTDQVVWLAAIIFYILYILGLSYFVILPSIGKSPLYQIFLKGAFFGFICYATYDLTNLATVKGWPFKVVWVDLLWGAFITGVVSLITVFVAKFFYKT
jgi:uncharacterized membrane protein